MNFGKITLKAMREGIKYKKNLAGALGFQVAGFIAVVLWLYVAFFKLFIPEYAKLSKYKSSLEQIQIDPQAVSAGEVAQLGSIVNSLYVYLVIGAIIFALLYILFKGLVWLKITETKWSVKKLLWVMLFNILIPVIFVLIGVGFFFIFRPTAFLVFGLPLIMLLMMQLLGVFNSSIMLDSIKGSLKNMWSIGIKKIQYFLIPHVLVFVAFLAITVLVVLAGSMLGFLSEYGLFVRRAVLIIFGLAFLLLYQLLFLWQKNYIYRTFKLVKH